MNHQVIFTRHSAAKYKTYAHEGKMNPMGAHDIKIQIVPDLSDEGVLLAREQANLLLDELDPNNDVLFVVSSHEVRALETAYYYVGEALKRGFEVVEHKVNMFGDKIVFPHLEKVKVHTGNAKNYVRPLKALSVNIPNNLAGLVYNPERIMSKLQIDWEQVDGDTKVRWQHARKMICSNDHGSWGENFFYHSQAISGLFPGSESAKSARDDQLNKILKLVSWGLKKAHDLNLKKNIKLMGFDHENYWGLALEEYFRDHRIGNCQSVAISIDEGKVNFIKRGNWKSLN